MVEEEDFYINYTCKVSSDRGSPSASFTLQPTDPNNLFPIGVLLITLVLVFTVSIVIYHRFKINIMLSLRRMFPLLHTNTDSNGKLYDAYVAYPRVQKDEVPREEQPVELVLGLMGFGEDSDRHKEEIC
ncbi:interleukin-1 receptor-like 2 [Salmo salar]|uniref:Interleukin-1 receptor-like 2 n=1 Tax=Salmo salar TaxID=8030 RepID=A0ABM3DPF1_SALSA|nr:interleukin-1 receptor-like 2 [Salmo salar]